jgi:tape measure domain-containing protein
MITGAVLQTLVTANTQQGQAQLNAFADTLDRVHAQLKAMKPTGDQVLVGLLKFEAVRQVTQIVQGYSQAAVQSYAANERLEKSLQSLVAREKLRAGSVKDMTQAMAQSGVEARKLLEWTQKLAIQSPFSQEGVAQAFKMAQSYGFVSESADKTVVSAKRLTQAMIDYASGSGQTEASMSRIALALGQIQAKGKLSGEEMLQLTETGLNVRDILAQAFGKTTAEIVKMQEQGLIPADKAIKAIVESLERDFGGAAKAQAGTITGLLNSLEDIQEVAGREFFGGAIKALQPQLQALTDFFGSSETMGNIREWGDAIGQGVANAIPAITKLGLAARGTFTLLGGLVSSSAGMFAAIPQPIYDLAIPAVLGLTVAIKGMATAETAAAVVTALRTGALNANTAALLANAAAALKGVVAYGTLAAAATATFIAFTKYVELKQSVADATQALLEGNSAWQTSTTAMSAYEQATEATKARVSGLKQELEKLREEQQQDISNTAWNSTLTGQVGEGDLDRLRERQARIEQLSASLQMATAFERENGAMVAARASALGVASQQEQLAAKAAQEHAAQLMVMTGAAAQDILAKAQQAQQAQLLAEMEERLAGLSGAVISGHMNESQAAYALARAFNIAYQEALKLVRAKMLLASGGNEAGLARIVAQGQQTRDLTQRTNPNGTVSRGVIAGAPGRQGSGDVDAAVRNVAARKAEADAERAYAEAVGGTGTALKNAQADLKGMQVGSEEYWKTRTKIAGLESQLAKDTEKAAKAGGAGSKAKVTEEEKAQERIAEIAEDAGKRLVEIDRKYAEQRAQAHKALAAQILMSSADMVAQQEANDLELAGMSQEQLEKVRAREQAEAEARARQAEIVMQARERAAQGDADLAQKELDIRSDANQKRQQLDQEYYERQRELAGNPEQLAVLQQQYDEARAAFEQSEAIRLELAQAAAAEIAGKAEEEKQAVITAAKEKMDAVKSASEGQRQAVVSDLQQQSNAAASFAGAWESAAGRVQAAAQRAAGAIAGIPAPGSTGASAGGASTGGGASSPAANNGVKAAGGGRFLTRGITHIIAGDNPGGVELVTVTPISGRGQTRVFGNVMRMAGGGEAILDPSTSTNPALQSPAGGTPKESKRRGWGADEDALYQERLARVSAMEREYLAQKEKLNEQHFWKELDRDLAVRRAQREVQRNHAAQTERLDQEQARRAQEILKGWLNNAQGAEGMIADARTLAAEKTAAALAAVDSEMGRKRNAALAAQDQQYYANAARIAAEGAKAQTSVEAFWQTVRIADLSAANQEARALINAEQDRMLERELERTRHYEEERARVEEQIAGERAQSLEEQAKEIAEREFQARRDALDDQQWKDERIASRNYDRYTKTIDDKIEKVMKGFENLWKDMFLVQGADVGKGRYEELQKRASGGRYDIGPLLVGEYGRELLWPDRPGYVSNAQETRQLLGSGDTYTIQIGPQPVGVDLKAVEDAAYRGQKRALTETGRKAEILRRTQ